MFNIIRNYYLYFLGLIVGGANRLRRLIIGYTHPRPIANHEINENIDYVCNVIANFKTGYKRLTGYDLVIKNKDVLEIGPGPDLGTGLVFISQGAKTYTAIDRFSLVVNNSFFYDQLAMALKTERVDNIIKKIKKSLGVNKEIRQGDFNYLNVSAKDLVNPEKYDLICSQAVLEHTEDSQVVIDNMHQNLRQGGVVCHEIDLATHTRLIKNQDPLNILRYGRSVYSFFLRFKGAPNRLRLSDYVNMFERAGFKNVKTLPLTGLSQKELEKVKKYLSREFQIYEDGDLRVLSSLLVATK